MRDVFNAFANLDNCIKDAEGIPKRAERKSFRTRAPRPYISER